MCSLRSAAAHCRHTLHRLERYVWCQAARPVRVTQLAFITWVVLRSLIQEAIQIHEDVVHFDHEVLIAWPGDMYIVMSVVMYLDSFGVPCRRPRRVTFLVHRVKVHMECFWLAKIVDLGTRVCHIIFSQSARPASTPRK